VSLGLSAFLLYKLLILEKTLTQKEILEKQNQILREKVEILNQQLQAAQKNTGQKLNQAFEDDVCLNIFSSLPDFFYEYFYLTFSLF